VRSAELLSGELTLARRSRAAPGIWPSGTSGCQINIRERVKYGKSADNEGQLSATHIPGYYASKPGIQIGTYMLSSASDEDIQFLQQHGTIIVDHIPGIIGGHRVGEAYSIGYRHPVVQTVKNE
jgi:hypothetical protein